MHAVIKKACNGADGHRFQCARLVAAYLQSQSQASSLRQGGDKPSGFWSEFWWYQHFTNFEVVWPPTGEKFRNLALN